MPISCPIPLRSLSTHEFRELDYAVMNQAFATHTNLGRLADESIFRTYFAKQLRQTGFSVQREVPIDVEYETFQKQYLVDLVVRTRGIYEVKVVNELTAEHEMQLLNYLLLLDVERGKLINFRPQRVKSRFVNAPARRRQRQRFGVSDNGWTDQSCLREKTIGMLRDWGTGLSLALYTQAATHFMGGEFRVIRNLPMDRDGDTLGRQRFHLIGDDEAFRITALTKELCEYESNLQKLLRHSPLRAIHWINISLTEVTLRSVR